MSVPNGAPGTKPFCIKKEETEKHRSKNLKIAESRIKLGLVLNEYGEKNNLKV